MNIRYFYLTIMGQDSLLRPLTYALKTKYPGYLTHILQGPDVVLNKPINTEIENILQKNQILSGNTDLTGIVFIATVDHAVKKVCTLELVQKAFGATGVIPFNPAKIEFNEFKTGNRVSFTSSSYLHGMPGE